MSYRHRAEEGRGTDLLGYLGSFSFSVNTGWHSVNTCHRGDGQKTLSSLTYHGCARVRTRPFYALSPPRMGSS